MALNRKLNTAIDVRESISNTSINIITITEDKLEVILIKHIQKVKRSNDWIGAVALSVSLIGMTLTTSFHSIFGVSADTIKGGFYTLTLISLFYAIYTVYNCYKNRDSVDAIIKDIKNL